MGFTGLGFGENSLHIDMRKGKATWGYGPGGTLPAWAQSTAMKHKAGAIKAAPYSANASAVAVDGIFEAVTSHATYGQLTDTQKNALWFDYASKYEVKTEDDLRIVEGILNHRQANGVPPVSETADYGEKSRALIEQKRTEFQKANTGAQTPIIMKVNEAIDAGLGVTEIRKIREQSGENYFTPSWWQDVELKAAAKEVEVKQKRSAANANAAEIDKIRTENIQLYTVGQAFGDLVDRQVPDPNNPGKTVTYSAKDQKEDARNAVLQIIDKTVADNKLPEEARWGMVAAYLGKSNDTHPAWVSALKATPKSFNAATAAEGVSPQMVQNAKLYDYLKGSGNYLFLDAHMEGDGTKTFWSMYDSFRGQGQNEKEALFSTYKVMNDKGVMAEASSEVNFAKSEYFKNRTSFADSELEGSTVASAKVTDMAEALAATGHSGSDALKQAIDMYKETHVFAKGAWVPKNLKGLPENFVDNVTEYVDSYITQYGAKANPPITDAEDVIIAPDASGTRFYLFQKSTGLPLMGKAAKGGVSKSGVLAVTMDTLRGYDKLKNDRASIEGDTNRAAMADAIAQADGTANAPVTVNTPSPVAQARGAVETSRPATPQEIIQKDKKSIADGVETDINLSERKDPNNLKVKAGKLKDLTDDQLRGYIDRGSAKPDRYLPEEWNLIKSEAKRRGWNIE
jgi:hypothetical protein